MQDQKLFENIYESLFASLVRFSMAFGFSKEASEDIVQDVILAFLEKRNAWEFIRDIDQFLFMATKNKCIDYLRRKECIRLYTSKMCQSAMNEQYSCDTPDKITEANELQRRIDQTVDKMPERCKQIFVMAKYNGKKYKEISENLNLSINTIECQMTKALKILRCALAS